MTLATWHPRTAPHTPEHLAAGPSCQSNRPAASLRGGTAATELIYHAPLVNPTRTGTAIASFDATTSGDYRISADSTTGTRGTIAIGDDILWDAAPHVAGTIAVFLVGVGAGLTLIVVTALRRSSARNRARVNTAPR